MFVCVCVCGGGLVKACLLKRQCVGVVFVRFKAVKVNRPAKGSRKESKEND